MYIDIHNIHIITNNTGLCITKPPIEKVAILDEEGVFVLLFHPANLLVKSPVLQKMAEAPVPDRDNTEYEPYLAQKIEEEEIRLKSLQDKCRKRYIYI